MMEPIRRLSDKELSDLENLASELLGHKSDQLDKDVKAGRLTPEQIDLSYREIFDTYIETRREVESEQLRRKTNRVFRNRILSAIAALFVAAMIYFMFLK